MSRLRAALATSHTLSLAAMEEASRVGQRHTGLDHLLLALTLSEQPAGQVLRERGVTLEAARAAVAAQHAEQLAGLGITLPAAPEGRIVFHETGGYEWDAPSRDVFNRAASGRRRGDAAAVLRELLEEPSGLIEGVLARLGTHPAQVRERLDEVEASADPSPGPGILPARRRGGSTVFVPAPPERVWELLSDPRRMHEWDPTLGAPRDPGEASEPASGSEHTSGPEHPIPAPPASARAGDTWIARARTEREDGSPLRVRERYRYPLVELREREENRLLEWSFRYPEDPRASSRRLRIEIEHAAGGSLLRLSYAWVPPEGGVRWSPLRLLARPLTRFALWIQLTSLGGGIARAFR